MAQETLYDTYRKAGRNLDSLVDENTLVIGELGNNTYGIFKFFQGIKNFFKGISALGSLASTGKIPVVADNNGTVQYVTPQQIVDAVSTISGNKVFNNNVEFKGTVNCPKVYKFGNWSTNDLIIQKDLLVNYSSVILIVTGTTSTDANKLSNFYLLSMAGNKITINTVMNLMSYLNVSVANNNIKISGAYFKSALLLTM